MELPTKLLLRIMVTSVLISFTPADAWYKQVAGPSYYSVGRASGLLSGMRRSPYVRRAELEPTDSGETATNGVFAQVTAHRSILKTMPVCIKDITPNLQSCEFFQEEKGSFKCKADIFLSLDSSDCAGD